MKNKLSGKTMEVAEPLLFNINLQLFSEEPPAIEPKSGVEAEISQKVADPEPQKPVQDADTNAQFAKVRREAEQKARDSMIAEMYGATHGIYTYADYQKALADEQARQEAEELASQGKDPEVYQKLTSMEQKLSKYERQEMLAKQDAQLENDPKTGQFYKQWKDEVHQLAEQYNADYSTAFTLLCKEKLADIAKQPDLESIKKEAVKEYLDRVKSGQKPVEAGGASPVIVSETPKTFEDARKQALQFMRQSKGE